MANRNHLHLMAESILSFFFPLSSSSSSPSSCFHFNLFHLFFLSVIVSIHGNQNKESSYFQEEELRELNERIKLIEMEFGVGMFLSLSLSFVFVYFANHPNGRSTM